MNEKIFTNFKPESTFCHNVDLYHHALTHEVHFDVAPPTCPTIPMERHHHKSSKIPSQFVKKKKYIKRHIQADNSNLAIQKEETKNE